MFLNEVGVALRDRGRWALFSMREDFIAQLDPYLGLIPNRLTTRYRLDLLTAAAAVGTVQHTAESALVDFTDEAADARSTTSAASRATRREDQRRARPNRRAGAAAGRLSPAVVHDRRRSDDHRCRRRRALDVSTTPRRLLRPAGSRRRRAHGDRRARHPDLVRRGVDQRERLSNTGARWARCARRRGAARAGRCPLDPSGAPARCRVVRAGPRPDDRSDPGEQRSMAGTHAQPAAAGLAGLGPPRSADWSRADPNDRRRRAVGRATS